MRILFDAGPLGNGFRNTVSRCGIFRTVVEMLNHVATNIELQTDVIATGHLDYSLVLPEAVESFIQAPVGLPVGSFDRFCYKYLKKLRRHQILSQELHRGNPWRILMGGLWHLAINYYPQPHLNTNYDIYHSFIPAFVPSIKAKQRVMTIYDAIPAIHPEFFSKNIVDAWWNSVNSMNPKRDWAMCISRATCDDFVRITGFPKERTSIITLGIDKKFVRCNCQNTRGRVAKKYNLPDGEWVLSLSALEPRKNLAGLVNAMIGIWRSGRKTKLVLAGPVGWKIDDFLNRIASDPEIRNMVHLTGFIDDDDLPVLYSMTSCFVYPSFYEGFGLPPVEAMACGAPVVTSNTSSMPEAVGDAALLIDPKNPETIASAILRILDDKVLSQTLAEKGIKQAARYTWEQCAEDCMAVYKQIMAS